MGSFLFGTYDAMCCVVIYHVHCAINIRSWNKCYTGVFIFSA